MYPEEKKLSKNRWMGVSVLFVNSKTSPIYLKILVGIGILKIELSSKYIPKFSCGDTFSGPL